MMNWERESREYLKSLLVAACRLARAASDEMDDNPALAEDFQLLLGFLLDSYDGLEGEALAANN